MRTEAETVASHYKIQSTVQANLGQDGILVYNLEANLGKMAS